ncbi:MAG TPA: hydrogenase maturation nickel metallochaperone HypA [Acidothermaceae bacterium]
MHEISLVGELLEEVERRAAGRPVALVVVRHASTIGEETIRQAFTMLAADGALANARLVCEEFEIVLTCPACGFTGALDHDHLAGHVRVCPRCGDITGDSGLAELELERVIIDN